MKQLRTLPILLAEDHGDDTPDEAVEFVLPENLCSRDADGNPVEGAVEDTVLADLETEALALFDAIRANPLTPQSIQALNDLTLAVEAIRSEAAVRIDAAADLVAQADELAGRIAVPDTPESVDDTPAPDDDAPADEPVAPVAEDTPDAPGDDGETVETPETEPVTVAAAAARPTRVRVPVSLGQIAQQAPTPTVDNPSDHGVSMVAAAELPGVTPGTRFDSTLDVAKAMHARARHLGNGHSAPIATISRPVAHTITEQMSTDQMQAVIAAAVALGDNYESLTAAGGWCAPSQILYDLFSMESTDGLFTLPQVGVERGGIQFPDPATVPTLADVFGTDALWVWTEQNDIDAHTAGGADPTKPCARIPCVEFNEERLDAHGICLTHGNLADRGYPELTRRFIDLVMAAHEHLMSVRRLAAVIAGSSAVTMDVVGGDAFSAVVNACEVQALDIRDKYRMSRNALMEAVFPMWIKAVIRASLSKRTGVDLLSVTDQQIEAAFAMRGVRPQFIYNWQSLQLVTGTAPDTADVSDNGGANNESTQYPALVDFLVYPAATWLEGTGGSINLAVTRDSTLNATNDYTAAFTEEFTLVAQRGPESRIVTATLDPSGETGAANISAAQY